MSGGHQSELIKQGWEALGAGEFDKLASYYHEDMIFVLPGQDDVLKGRDAFRSALDSVGQVLPPGFAIKSMRYCEGDNEVMNVVEWTADKLPGGSQLAITFRFNDQDQIIEERWFIDTEQWKAAF
ncbi:nuclear transport factor 2 family protein [Limibacillus halophilus]|jgi:ketosteroid isomerase-like protein